MKNALLVCVDKYPNGDAGAVRTHSFAKLLKAMGYEVTVVGLGTTTGFKFCEYDGIRFLSLRAESDSKTERFKNYFLFIKRLQKYVLTDDFSCDFVLASDLLFNLFGKLKKYCLRRGLPLIHDSVEWYSHQQFKNGRLALAYRAKERLNRHTLDDKVRVIAISSYLEKWFSSRNIKCVRIPVIMDISAMEHTKNVKKDKTVFLYAGSPGKKDYLQTVIAGAAAVSTDTDFELRLIGITKEQLVPMCGADPSHVEKLGEKLKCMGRKPRQNVLENLQEADFTILIRSEEQRYAKAGFPTKFVESFATATPVIANITSDLDMYLLDNRNGFTVESSSPQALAKVLEKALKLSFEKRTEMQLEARRTAEECFDYRIYSNTLKELIG